jgi:hypothetical protein
VYVTRVLLKKVGVWPGDVILPIKDFVISPPASSQALILATDFSVERSRDMELRDQASLCTLENLFFQRAPRRQLNNSSMYPALADVEKLE